MSTAPAGPVCPPATGTGRTAPRRHIFGRLRASDAFHSSPGVLRGAHGGPDAGPVSEDPEGLGYQSEDDSRGNDSDGELVPFTGIESGRVYVHVPEQVSAADQVRPGQGAGHQSVVPGGADDEDGPEGPEHDNRVEEPILVIPGLEVFRRGWAFLVHSCLRRLVDWRSLGRV